MPPTVDIEATQPPSFANTIVPDCAWDCESLIGSVSLPGWPAAAGGAHGVAGVLVVVLVLVEVTVEVTVDVLVDVDVEVELLLLADAEPIVELVLELVDWTWA